ncbi:MAG TPA: hypothetical protein DCM86_11435 [Verrucomicrobiales bacterium]|nr:hypothetical protein [Verrucomicrobiales bacterium]
MAYRALWVVGVVAGLFSLVTCAFLIANNTQLKRNDPIHAPALQRMVKQLKQTPQDETLKEQIREMDYLARRAFFSSQGFNQAGIWMLAGGLVVMVTAFKALSGFHRGLPFPDSSGPKDDLAANALWARKAVTVAALVLFGLALSLALPWKSTLDGAVAEVPSVPAPPGAPGGQGSVTGKGTAVPVAAAKPAAAAVVEGNAPPRGPGREERLRHWSSFRGGPVGARPQAATLPVEWDGATGRGVAWKTPVPLPGFGSPVLWGDRVFLSGGTAQARAVYAIDAKTGAVLWTRPVAASPGEPPRVLGDTGYAAPTLVCDGARVAALFATGDLVAFTVDGVPAWSAALGVPDNPYGHGSSLELHDGMLIVQYDQKKDGFVAAYDMATGAVRWKLPRKVGASWASPLLVELDGAERLVLVADAFLTVHDLGASGRELWRVEWGRAGDVATAPTWVDGLLVVACDHVKLAAIDPVKRAVAWENATEIPGVSTPVASGGFLFGGQSEGGIVCWEARTGKRRWLQETDDGFYASPILSGGRVYLMEKSGKMYIFEATGEAYKGVAQPVLGEEASATPAVLGNSLILRGAKNLFRIGT